MISQLSSR